MRELKDLAKDCLPKIEEARLVHAIQDLFVLKYLDSPIMSNECACPLCGGNNGYAVFIDPAKSDKRMWFCSEADCLTKVRLSHPRQYGTIPETKRALEWPLFCEMNDIGDLLHDVKFEKIEQTGAKIDYLLKFASNPKGIIWMQGEPGTGKTYASMGVCELFTRRSASVIFCTQTKMANRWLEDEKHRYINQLECCSLLVVDDFGTGDVTPSFMKFFLDLINTRTQWSNRGTIISTNLTDKDFSNFCGKALNDRIRTGQKFEFKEKSRRPKTIL